MTTKGQLIGKGTFSKVYLQDDNTVLIQSECWAKECIADYIESDIFPDLKRVGYEKYECTYYPKVKSLKTALSTEHYEIYKQLRSLRIDIPGNKYDRMDMWREQFEKIENEHYRQGLIDALDSLCNWGTQIGFEISPRNVAVQDGKLILLDCFYFVNQLQAVRNRKYTATYA